MSLTQYAIEAAFEPCIHHCAALYPMDDWVIEPKQLLFTKHKTKYGMAYSNGDIAINRAFIGSTSELQMIRTLCHEMAHLAVGLQHGHNKVFKQMNALFSRDISALQAMVNTNTDDITDDKGKDVLNKIGYAYWLIAHLDNGDSIRVKPVHRRSRRYAEYRPSLFANYRIKQQKVTKFEYIPYVSQY